jgi:hypothetical protein
MSCYPKIFKKVTKIEHVTNDPGYQYSLARSCHCIPKHLAVKEIWKNNLNLPIKYNMIESRHYIDLCIPLKVYHCKICDFTATNDF